MAAEKGRCDLCNKEVGVASLWKRIGFTTASRVHQVCGSCHSDKMNRDERLRFAKAGPKKAAKKPDEDTWRDASTPPDELRFGG